MKPPLPPPAASNEPLSSISTYYGGLEARNVDSTGGEVLIIHRNEEPEVKKPTPAKIDVRSVSPPAQSRRLVEKRSEQVKTQYERIIKETSNQSSDEQELAVAPEADDSLDERDEQVAAVGVNRQKSESSATDSMDRFERPSKFELQKLQHEKMLQNQQQQLKSPENTTTDDLIKVIIKYDYILFDRLLESYLNI